VLSYALDIPMPHTRARPAISANAARRSAIITERCRPPVQPANGQIALPSAIWCGICHEMSSSPTDELAGRRSRCMKAASTRSQPVRRRSAGTMRVGQTPDVNIRSASTGARRACSQSSAKSPRGRSGSVGEKARRAAGSCTICRRVDNLVNHLADPLGDGARREYLRLQTDPARGVASGSR
jgi:hypothetical protein